MGSYASGMIQFGAPVPAGWRVVGREEQRSRAGAYTRLSCLRTTDGRSSSIRAFTYIYFSHYNSFDAAALLEDDSIPLRATGVFCFVCSRPSSTFSFVQPPVAELRSFSRDC